MNRLLVNRPTIREKQSLKFLKLNPLHFCENVQDLRSFVFLAIRISEAPCW